MQPCGQGVEDHVPALRAEFASSKHKDEEDGLTMVATGMRTGSSAVYEIADRYRIDAIGRENSVFTPNRNLWTSPTHQELIDRFVDAPDFGGGTFESKLTEQLKQASDDARQLMSEILGLHLLITSVITAEKKLEIIEIPLNEAQYGIVPPDVKAALEQGFVNPGTFFNTGRPQQIQFLVRVGLHLAGLAEPERIEILDDPWRFREEIDLIPIDSALTQRHALLHLFFPDTFEASVSDRHIKMIVERFGTDAGEMTGDTDRDLISIRDHLTPRFGDGFDFYNARVAPLWQTGGDPWKAVVRWAIKFKESPGFDDQERAFKLGVASEHSDLTAAVTSGSPYLEALKDLQRRNDLLHFMAADDFLQWAMANESDARIAIADLTNGGSPVLDRIAEFARRIDGAVKSPGNKVAQASLFLLLTDPTTYPIYRPAPFTQFLKLVGSKHYQRPIERRYQNALAACDHLIAETTERSEVALRDRLDAQSLIWVITTADSDSPIVADWSDEERTDFFGWRDGVEPQPPSLVENPPPSSAAGASESGDEPDDRFEAAALSTHIPVNVLKGIAMRLRSKGQIVIYGPPGTGKTFVARHLATAVAGASDRVKVVQFHPSTTYEDFFEGIRPTSVDGTIRYDVEPGPLARMAATAANDRDNEYVLIIDELNRANIPKVFGELMYLLEYRDQEVHTIYRSETPFKLPDNLLVIATMNTVDRSVAVVDAALRRRFFFIPFFPDAEPISDVLAAVCGDNDAWVAELLDGTNALLMDRIGSRDHLLGPSYFIDCDRTLAGVRDVWAYAIEPTLEDHLFAQPEAMADFRWDAIAKRFADLIPTHTADAEE